MTLKHSSVAFVLLAALCLGCSSTNAGANRASSSGRTARRDPSSGGIAGSPAVSKAKTDETSVGAPSVAAAPTGSATIRLYDQLSASVNENVGWDCVWRRGSSCKIPFTGGYYLTKPAGQIVFEAFEDGSKTPTKRSSGLPVPKGSSPFQATFPYTVGATASSVTFRAVLLDSNGHLLAAGKAHTFEVGP